MSKSTIQTLVHYIIITTVIIAILDYYLLVFNYIYAILSIKYCTSDFS